MTRGEFDVDVLMALPSASVAAHELKTPLALIRQLGLALEDDTMSTDMRAEYYRQIVTVAHRALAVVTDMTQAATMQPSLFPLEPVNPLAVCRALMRETVPLAHLYNHGIVWPKSRSNMLIVANRHLLSRVIMNFLDNALKYSEPNMPIRLTLRKIGSVVRVGVRDYGPRLSRSDYNTLVHELEMMKAVRTRPESSGLGIYLASEFAKMMQGKIGLVRHRDGVTFFVELPLSGQMRLL